MIDMDDLVTRLLVYAEGSRRDAKREKDMGDALIHQNRALALDDAACHIKAQRAEMLRAGIAAIKCTELKNARIKRLEIINAELLGALASIKYASRRHVESIERLTNYAIECATTEKDEETP